MRLVAMACAAAAAGLAMAGPAGASDYSNECRSGDGVFEMNDGVLKQGDRNDVPYVIEDEQTFHLEDGYCETNNPAGKGQRFGFSSRTWRMRIGVEENGVRSSVHLMCELASSGLPAAFGCDRSATTRKENAYGPVQSWLPGAKGSWDHNGSTMKLEAEGAERRFVYMHPREGLLAVGVRPGAYLFEGRREGSAYVGEARIFSRKCGEQRYDVRGEVEGDESRVTLKGNAPRLDDGCKVIGTRPDTLVFERAR